MRFYSECVNVAKSVGALMNDKQIVGFVQAEQRQLNDYHLTLGLWIRHHLLPHNTYLCDALEVLGLATSEEKSKFLVDFARQYWKLALAEMM